MSTASMYVKLHPQKVEEDASQQWQVNSTTHLLFASVQYPKVCITMMHDYDFVKTILTFLLVLEECNGNGYQSSNPDLTDKYHQRFYSKPALFDKNKEQLCYYD